MLISNLDLIATASDGVTRLRELILTLAVQGKLVPQDPNDEPASALVKKIRLEKERLIAEGKVKRDKPLSDIAAEEKPFKLPKSWEWVRLADVVRVINGRAYSKDELLESGPTPVLRVGNLFTSNHWYYSNLDLEPEKYCNEGDLLYAWSASFGPFIWGGPKAIYHYHIWKLEPWSERHFDTGYFHKFLAEKTAEIKAAGHGVSMIHMTKEKMEKIVVPYPPLAEQSRIVTRVEELMRLCDALEAKGQLEVTQHAQLVSTLLGTLTDSETPEELAENWQRIATHFDLLLDRPEAVDALEQTILQLAVRGLLVPQDPQDEPACELLKKIRGEKDKLIAQGTIKRDKPLPPIAEGEQPFALPQGWEWVRLNSLLQKIGAGSTPLGGREVYVSSGVKFLRSQNVWNDGLRLDNVAFIKPETHARMSGTVVIANDLLFNITGASIGRCAVVPSDFDEANVSQHVTIVRTVLPELNAFLHKVLVSRHVQQAVMDVQVGVSREGLSIAKLGQFLIPVPPLAEQSRIVTRVAQLRRLCADLRQRLTSARERQSQLAQALVEQQSIVTD